MINSETIIGAKIAYLRNKKDITFGDLYIATGIECGYLRRVESGEINPSAEKLLIILNAIGVTADEFNGITLDSHKYNYDEIPNGAFGAIEGLYYKIGVRGGLYYWDGNQWLMSTRNKQKTIRDIENKRFKFSLA